MSALKSSEALFLKCLFEFYQLCFCFIFILDSFLASEVVSDSRVGFTGFRYDKRRL